MAQAPDAARRAGFQGEPIARRRLKAPRSRPIGAFCGFASIHNTAHSDQRSMLAVPSELDRAISIASASSSRKKMQEAGSA